MGVTITGAGGADGAVAPSRKMRSLSMRIVAEGISTIARHAANPGSYLGQYAESRFRNQSRSII